MIDLLIQKKSIRFFFFPSSEVFGFGQKDGGRKDAGTQPSFILCRGGCRHGLMPGFAVVPRRQGLRRALGAASPARGRRQGRDPGTAQLCSGAGSGVSPSSHIPFLGPVPAVGLCLGAGMRRGWESWSWAAAGRTRRERARAARGAEGAACSSGAGSFYSSASKGQQTESRGGSGGELIGLTWKTYPAIC